MTCAGETDSTRGNGALGAEDREEGGAHGAVRAAGTVRVGILGGLGPAAGADYYARLVAATSAEFDQDHVPVIMWADPTVPDRTQAFRIGRPPWAHLAEGVRALRDAGANLLVSPCNTIHIWLPQAAAEAGIELVSIVAATVAEAVEATAPGEAIGLLATGPTLESGIYTTALTDRGRVALGPEPSMQERVIEAIYAVKQGRPGDLDRAQELTASVVADLAARGARVVVSACTETSLALAHAAREPNLTPTSVPDDARPSPTSAGDIDAHPTPASARMRDSGVPVIDSTDALVTATLRRWRTLRVNP